MQILGSRSDMPFRDLVGPRLLFDLLARAARRGSLPPSLVFAGPDGVGKRAAAVALAQLLNCSADRDGADAPDACGVCAACRRIVRRVHPDVVLLEPGDSAAIKVDQVREVIEAQNALLKTLEEPPSGSIFVLVTARPDVLLPTVRSRCQRVRFGRLTEHEIASVLMTRHGFESGEAHAAAAAADGSLGRALAESTGESAGARSAAAALLNGVAEAPDPVRRLALSKALAASGGGKGATERDALARRLRALGSLLRDVQVLSAGAPDRWLANADIRESLAALARSFDRERTLRGFAAVDRALDALERNASAKVVADWVAATL